MKRADTGAELSFEGVSKAYGALTVLNPTTLRIKPGEFFALLGPSGSGKTTLLSIVAGFVTPSGGRVMVNGQDITGMPPEKRNIGMVFQNYSLFPYLTAYKNVAFPLEMRRRPQKEIDERVKRALEMVRLGHLAGRFPGQLSGGQQQRVALARAAVYDPALLLMDEPLGALDENLRDEMQEEIRQFHAKVRATVIYVTHAQHEAATLADRTAILNHGRVEQCGPQQELYERPANAFVASFLGEANIFNIASIERLAADGCSICTMGGLKIIAVALSTSEASLVACIRPENIAMSKTPLTLANAFTGTIADAIQTSEVIRYHVRVGEQNLLHVRTTAKRGMPRFSVNESVFAGWGPEDILTIPNRSNQTGDGYDKLE